MWARRQRAGARAWRDRIDPCNADAVSSPSFALCSAVQNKDLNSQGQQGYLAQKKTPVGNCADPHPVFCSEAKDTKRKAQEEKKKVKKVAPGAGNTGGAAVKMGKAGGAGTIAPGRSSAPGKKSAR